LYDIQLSTTMEAKLNQLTSDISGLIRNFLMIEVSEYRENYEYMLRSPLCQKLLNEIEELKRKQCQDATTNTLPKTESDVSDGEYYKFDREYALTPPGEKKKDNIELEIKEDEEENDAATASHIIFSNSEIIDIGNISNKSVDKEEEVEVTDDESGGEGSPLEEESEEEEVEVTDNESEGEEEAVEVTDNESEGEEEEVEVTDNESEGEGSPLENESEGEEEAVEATDDESGGEGSPLENESEGEEEAVEATDDESGGEGSPLENESEEEEEEVVEVTDDESGGEVTDDESGEEGSPLENESEEEEVVEVTDDESGGEEEESGDEGEESEDDEEEEVFEFEYKGKKYFATDEVNGILYANVDDDIGDEVGKIQNKNVILF